MIIINQGRIVRDGDLDQLRAEVAPWARVEFRTNLPAKEGMEALAGVPRILFHENTTISGDTSLRCLVDKDATDAALADVGAAFASRGGQVRDPVVTPAALEDLFTTLTRGSQRAEVGL